MLIMISVLYVCQRLANGLTRQLTDKKNTKSQNWKHYSNTSFAKINIPNTVLAYADLEVYSSHAKQYLKLYFRETEKQSLHQKDNSLSFLLCLLLQMLILMVQLVSTKPLLVVRQNCQDQATMRTTAKLPLICLGIL